MNDPLSTSMFWVGAMFAFTPVVVGGAVLAVWWRMRKAEQHTAPGPADGPSSTTAEPEER